MNGHRIAQKRIHYDRKESAPPTLSRKDEHSAPAKLSGIHIFPRSSQELLQIPLTALFVCIYIFSKFEILVFMLGEISPA